MTYKRFLKEYEDLSGKLIIVTGGTSGIGCELIKHLLSKNASVLMLSRNLKKADKYIIMYKSLYPSAKIDVLEYDQASFESIRKACDVIVDKYSDFYALVANAGTLVGPKGGYTVDGYPTTIGVNYVGVRYLLDYLTSKLDKPHKFVIQGSIVGGLKLKKNADLKNGKYGVFTQYNISKIYLEAYVNKLQHNNPKHEYILTEPGISSTHITRHFNVAIRASGKVFLSIFFHSPKKASLTLLDGIRSPNGEYIVPRGLLTMSGLPKHKKFPHHRVREQIVKD